MVKQFTRKDILKIADKVIGLIEDKVGNDPNLMITVIQACRAQAEVEDRLKLEYFLDQTK